MPDADLAPIRLQDSTQDEIDRQFEILAREHMQRIIFTMLGFALCAIYISPLFAIVLAALDALSEIVNLRLMRGMSVEKTPGRYRGTLLCVATMEFSFTLAAGLIWQVEDPYAKAFACGLVMMTLLHLTTVRSIHLPYGLVGLVTVALTAITANSYYWIALSDWGGLAASTAAILCGTGYTLVAMQSNHKLHQSTAEGRASARASDAAKTRFLAQMSHELRTPLNAIIGLGRIERDETQAELSRTRLATIVASAEGLAVVLDDILELSSITHGRMVLRPQDVNIRRELSTIASTFTHQAAELGLGLHIVCDNNLPEFATFDPQRLRQCLINLISNSLKHVKSGAIDISAYMDGASTLVCDVADTGPGVADAYRDLIFEPYAMGGTLAEGSGLGLSITRSLARQMGGDLVLVPSQSGALFRLSLAVRETTSPAPHLVEPVPDLSGMTVLVVDDISSNRLVTSSFLKSTRAEVVEVESGIHALDMIEKRRIDLVLLDMNMPGLDGMETFALIRALPLPRSRIPVVAITADVLPARRAAIEASGFDGYLAKPLSMERLHAVLRRCLLASTTAQSGR